jgi:hypothetical protein
MVCTRAATGISGGMKTKVFLHDGRKEFLPTCILTYLFKQELVRATKHGAHAIVAEYPGREIDCSFQSLNVA